MFTREEASRLRQEFWTTFGLYMKPVLSVDYMRVNWINYNTRLKDVYFRMDTGRKAATIAITMEHSDPGIRELFFEQFLELKTMLHTELGEEWEWQEHYTTESGKVISRIYKELPKTSVFNKDKWPELISFFKPRIIALDRFWDTARYAFDALT
ncbi:DUF4268 domain-containing protein [Marinoscillum furvescens]|uniref:Uncharacterized protein DUF4268 n=1 Tax=Marinoscillum furvescens DSM 4134 TaxID=1122208 RepID=A0A3D9L4W2_MARFU|nr:DUF4268 domain-containing protein [Marinoscillum furvescens]REE00559.1 uncharacterized protein DUF4268 [Marinoscillum furvescens DSM 4134]